MAGGAGRRLVAPLCTSSSATAKGGAEVGGKAGRRLGEKVANKPMTAAQKGNFFEIRELKHHGGKLFVASDKVTPAHKALPFPSFPVHRLSDDQDVKMGEILTSGKVTLVAASFKNIGYNMLQPWTDAAEKQCDVDTIFLSFIESRLLKLLRGTMLHSMRGSFAPALHDRTFVYFGDTEDIRESLDIPNRLSGFVYLVDGAGRVRWSGCGNTTDEELQSMVKCCFELQKENL